MKENIKLVTFLELLFLTILILSGAFGGVFGKIVYYSAFVMPISLGIYFIAKRRKSKHGARDTLRISIKKQELIFSVPLFAPTVILIILVSFGVSALMSLFGIENTASYGSEPFLLAVVIHALIPAIAEEVLFRYIPIELMSGASNGNIIIVTAIFFSFAHANLFSIPYALIAGIIFAAIDIKTKSILPSLILHFLNNTLSLALMYGAYITRLSIFVALGALSAVCAVIIFIRRKTYADSIRELFVFSRSELAPYPLLFIFASLFIAITNIIFS